MRCPACNANRTREIYGGYNITSHSCDVCGAQWMGDLFSEKEIQTRTMTIDDLVAI